MSPPAPAVGVLGPLAQVSRRVVVTAVSGNVFLGVCAFWMSYAALSDLARRAGVGAQAWVWPLIVDGLIVVATMSVLALSPYGRRGTWFAWLLLIAGAAVSIVANGAHAVWTGDPAVPAPMRVTIAAVPPVVEVAVTHLTVELIRRYQPGSSAVAAAGAGAGATGAAFGVFSPTPETELVPINSSRVEAGRLRVLGWSNRRIAQALGVHPSTVSRWLTVREPADDADEPATARQETSVT